MSINQTVLSRHFLAWLPVIKTENWDLMKFSISQLCKLSRVLQFLHQYALMIQDIEQPSPAALFKWLQQEDGRIALVTCILFIITLCVDLKNEEFWSLNLAGPSLDSSIRHSALPLEYCCQHQGHCCACVVAGDWSMDTLHRYPHP